MNSPRLTLDGQMEMAPLPEGSGAISIRRAVQCVEGLVAFRRLLEAIPEV